MDIQQFLFGRPTRQLVYKSLDAASQRARVISDNLANVMTPDYKRKEVNFEEQLQRAMKPALKGTQTQEEHLPLGGKPLNKVQPFIYESTDAVLPGEINNVDIDLEAVKMAENQILYNYAIKFVGFDKLNSAISGKP